MIFFVEHPSNSVSRFVVAINTLPKYHPNRVPVTMPTKSLKQAAGGRVARNGTKPAPKAKSPKVLTRLEKLQVLSKLEKAGVLSLLESNGITLKFIEENKLLSKAESSGLIGLLSDRETPKTLAVVGVALIVAALATVVAVPDDNSVLNALQGIAVVGLGGGALASFLGSSFIADLQTDS